MTSDQVLLAGDVTIREATPAEDDEVARCFYEMWMDMDYKPESVLGNWKQITTDFFKSARENLSFSAAVAVSSTGKIVGSSSCQLFSGPFPIVFNPEFRKDGYIWGVYVEPALRGKGIAKKLVLANLDHLRSVGCTHAVLNASVQGRPVYEKLGFEAANAMRLDLRKAPA